MTTTAGSRGPSEWIGLAVAVALALLAGSALLRPGFYDSHDGLLNVHRLFELEKCLADGQLPCRWAPDMGGGYGAPVGNFYPPLPSFVAEVFRALGASLLDAVKWTFLLALVVGAAGAFRLASCFFGPAGGVLAAGLYTFAPYQAIDVFVRGALGEAWGMALLPHLFLSGYRTLASPGPTLRAGVACAFAGAALLLSHSLVVLMAAPAYAAWLLGAWRTSDVRREGVHCAVAGHALGFALAAFFVLPLLFELRHVHADTLVSLHPWARFENNFVGAGQLLFFPRPFGYGAVGTADAMSVCVGRLHALLGLGTVVAVCALAARARRLEKTDVVALFFGGVGIAAVAMILPASEPLWQLIRPLAFLQFPWRFLVVAAFGLALAAGWIPFALRSQPVLAWGIAILVPALAVASGWQSFRPRAMHRVAPEVLANEREIALAKHGLYDYLPRSVDLDRFIAAPPPPLPAPVHAPANVSVRDVSKTSGRIAFEAEVPGDDVLVRLGVFDFPGWTLYVDGEPAEFAESDDPFGRLHVPLRRGTHVVEARLENTPVRSFANGISALALLVALLWTAALMRPR